MLETAAFSCPYCGEYIEMVVDCSVAEQEYIEDCEVCCRPVVLHVQVDEDLRPTLSVRRDDEI